MRDRWSRVYNIHMSNVKKKWRVTCYASSIIHRTIVTLTKVGVVHLKIGALLTHSKIFLPPFYTPTFSILFSRLSIMFFYIFSLSLLSLSRSFNLLFIYAEMKKKRK